MQKYSTYARHKHRIQCGEEIKNLDRKKDNKNYNNQIYQSRHGKAKKQRLREKNLTTKSKHCFDWSCFLACRLGHAV